MSQAISGVIIGGGNIYSSPATKHEFLAITTNKFTYKVVQSANQIITSTPVGRTVNNSDGTISLAFTDDITISPNTNYIPGVVQRSYDDNTHTYTVTATDAEPIDGLVQDGWSVVYQPGTTSLEFYPNPDFTGTAIHSDNLQGNILIGGMLEVSNESGYAEPSQNSDILKFKNIFITSVGEGFLGSCRGLTYVELPNLTSAGACLLWDCRSLTSVELPNLTSVGETFLYRDDNIRSIECPKLKSIYVNTYESMGEASSSSPMYFVDFGYITNANEPNFYYAQVMVLRADTVPTNFTHSLLSEPVLYIVPSALVDTYKSKVRSQDVVTALEKSPFADGKTVCGNNMKTEYGAIPDSDAGLYDYMLLYSDEKQKWESLDKISIQGYIDTGKYQNFFVFYSKLTRERGYTINTRV